MYGSRGSHVQVLLCRVYVALVILLFCSSLASAQILLSASTVPAEAQPGAVVSLEGKGWPANTTIPAASVQVTITPPAGNGLPVTVAAGSIANTPGNTTGTDRTIKFTIPTSLTTNSPLTCAVSITATTSSNVVLTSGATAALTVDPPPTVAGVSPGAATIGATVTLTVTGAYTHFSSNTAVSLVSPASPAFTIAQTGATTYNPASPNQVVATFTIPSGASGAPVGSYTVVARTGTESASLPGGFLVSASGPATLSSITPNSLAAGQSTTVNVVGTNTHFVQGVTVAALGNGITAGPVTVTSLTQASFQISIDPIAILGARTLTMETNGEFGTGTFTVLTNGSSLQSVAMNTQNGPVIPASFAQGTNGTLTLTGSLNPPTHWVQAGSSISIGGGINAGNITVLSPTSLSVNISVGPGVALGSYPVTVTTNGEIVAKTNAVTVTAATPFLSSASPSSAAQGQQHAIVTFTGAFTSFTTTTNGALSVNFGPNITVNSVTASSATSATADISIDNVASTGGRTCTLSSNGTNYNFTFTVTPSGAALTAVAPGSGLQSSSVALTVAGTGTHWGQGLTSAALGVGITVNRVVVNSATTAEVDITIAANASLGSYPLTMSTGGEIVTLSNAFTVLPFTPSLTLSPSSGMIAVAPQTTNVVNVNFSGNFTHFGSSSPNQTIAAIDGNGVSIQNFTVLNKFQATAQLVIDQTAPSSPGTTVSPAAPCTNQYGGNRTVTLETPMGSSSEIVQAGFCVTSTPAVLTSISPFHSGEPAQSLTVSITGNFTHFEPNVTTVGFGPNITVDSFNIVNNNLLTAVIDIAPNALLGWRPVFVNTVDPANLINEQVMIGFAIDAPASASLLSVSPNSGIQGQSVTVQITGNHTNWAQGSTTAIFGAGITVNTLTINGPASATAQISIDPVNAPAGGSSVTLVTELAQGNEEIVSGPGFSVTQGISSISFLGTGCLNDATAAAAGCQAHQFQVHQGDILTFKVIGANTHWKQGETTLNFGGDIAVSQLTVIDPLTIQCQIAVSYTAAIGFRGVTATTNAENAASFNDALDVLALQAISVNITPTSAPQGTTFTMQVNGVSTHWTSTAANPANNTTVTFGSNNGVTVTGINVISPTQMNLNVQVAGTAFTGPYTLTITTTGIPVSPNSPQGIEQMILTNVFGVSQGAAIITSVLPTSGTQSATEALVVVGQNTNFQTGLTTAALGIGGCSSPAGINVSNVTAADHLHATVSIAVSANAPTGFQTLCMYTLGETVSYANAFQVLPATPTLNQVAARNRPARADGRRRHPDRPVHALAARPDDGDIRARHHRARPVGRKRNQRDGNTGHQSHRVHGWAHDYRHDWQ